MTTLVVVFGSGGMLGWTLERYFRNAHDVSLMAYGRDELDASSPEVLDTLKSLSLRWESSRVVVVNAIGMIPQKSDPGQNLRLYVAVNSVFPHVLWQFCNERRYELIHICTDCVYDGKAGGYSETDVHTENNVYGVSKSCGEPVHAMMIRTSFVGEEKTSKTSLLEWVRCQAGKPIRGFTNHHWNGVTCLELTKVIHRIIQQQIRWQGVRHIVSPQEVTKYGLISLINSVYSLGCTVEPYETPPVNKVLLLSADSAISNISVAPLEIQLRELREFFKN